MRLIAAMLLALALFLTGTAVAAPTISGAIKGDYARITFIWPERIKFRTGMSGNVLNVTFEKPLASGPGDALAGLSPYVEKAVLSPDKRTLTLTLNQPYPIRNFVSGTAGGVDVMQVKSRPLLGKSPVNPAKAPAPVAKPPVSAKIAAAFPVPTEKPKPPVKTPMAEIATEAKPAAEEAKKTEGEEKKSSPPPLPSPAESVAATTVTGKQMAVTVHQQKVSASFFFPWQERTASAVFSRGRYLWIIFDKPVDVNLKSLNSILPEFVSLAERMEVPGHTVLRLTVTSPVSAAARHQRNSYEWIVTLSRRSTVPANPILTETSDKPPLKPYVAINLLQTSPSLTLTDPALGDRLEVIPSYEEGRGIFPERDFVDFRLLRTAQGVVIKRHSDAVRIVKQRTGLRVVKPGPGIILSKNMPPLDVATFMEAESNAGTFFPYSRWKTKDINEFYTRKQRLQREISRADDEKAGSLRKTLAELYLGEGLYHEALGVLDEIKARDPEYYDVYQLAALHGAANFMIDRVGEAARDFVDPALEGEEEIAYWNRFVHMMLGDEKQLTQFSAFDPRYSSHYPPKIRQKLAVIASDQLIGRKRYNAFNAIMNRLKKSKQLAEIKDQADYMVGRVLADTGNNADAIAVFKKLIENTKNRFVQVRAEFALATLEYETGAIDRAELIDRLDRLRYIWRGDALELGVLSLLGDLNALEGRYPQAMRVWKDILSHFPENPENTKIAAKMADMFVLLFNEDKADELEPLEALALYYEFRSLTPIGKEGDKMIQKLADRLARVDLLDRAAALLSHQVKFRLEKEERSRVANRLGLIYLLNREPLKTLEVLRLTGYGAGGEAINRQRNQLAAMAYSDIGNWRTALDMLKDDYSEEAKAIRLDIFWENKDWQNVTATAEDMLAGRKDPAALLSEPEAQTLLRLSVAYSFAGDTLQLQYLRDYFTSLLAGNPLKDRFLFISNDTGPINPNNMGALEQEISGIKSFLETYRSQVQENGLSSIN